MPDYVLKSELLRDGTVSEVKQIQKAFFKKFTGREISDEEYDEALRRAECIDFDDFNEATRILSAQHSRTKRLRSRIEDMLESFDDCTFVTLTFTDEVLKRTSSATRRRYVAYFLKSQSSGLPYVANIDFGAQNGREHYQKNPSPQRRGRAFGTRGNADEGGRHHNRARHADRRGFLSETVRHYVRCHKGAL